MANFIRLDIRTVNDSLRVFSQQHGIDMGIDESDARQNIIKYVFYHHSTNTGLVLSIDFEQVEDLDKSIDACLVELWHKFDLEG